MVRSAAEVSTVSRGCGVMSRRHKEGTVLLDTLATLVGCHASLEAGLPDGLRPDVIRLDLSSGRLFVGDAKHSESPASIHTQGRLLNYLRWFAAHLRSGRGDGVFAVCFSRVSDTYIWVEALNMLADEAGVEHASVRHERFPGGMTLVWFLSECCGPEHIGT
jgi:hypothetical protein